MMRPQLWMDSENGGLDPNVHSPLQFAFLAVKEGVVVDELEMQLRIPPLVVTPEALKINKVDLLIDGAIVTREAAKKLYYWWMNKNFFTESINGKPVVQKPSKETMPNFCGHNTAYDRRFLWALLESDYDMAYYHRIDTMVLGEVMREMGLYPGIENLKLGTLCAWHGDQVTDDSIHGFHNAVFDVRKTYWLYGEMKKLLAKGYMEKAEGA